MLYLIGLGLNEKGISLEGLDAIKICSKIYLENYTVDFPYSIDKLEKIVNKKIISLDRSEVESERIVNESKKEIVALLVYGCPLFATTHISLMLEAKNKKVLTKVIYAASVFDSIAETGLQLYKFGKISSMPKWQKNFSPDSFLENVMHNEKISAHTLILIDIGLNFIDAIDQLRQASEKREVKIEKLIVCSKMGSVKSNIFFGTLDRLKNKKISAPYCFIVPSQMHFLEKESIERYLV